MESSLLFFCIHWSAEEGVKMLEDIQLEMRDLADDSVKQEAFLVY